MQENNYEVSSMPRQKRGMHESPYGAGKSPHQNGILVET